LRDAAVRQSVDDAARRHGFTHLAVEIDAP
jgi:hypothetical protein